MSTSPTGHAQNVESMKSLTTTISTFIGYNPARSDLSNENLTQVQNNGEAALLNVYNAENAQKNAQSARIVVFEDLETKVVTPAINAMRICGASDQTVAQAESLVREIRGKRASDKLTEEEIAAAKAEGKEITQNTKHNAGYEQVTKNFGKLVSFFGTVPEYNPNEQAITLAALSEKHTEMKAVNIAVLVADAAHDAARMARDVVFNTDKTGLCDLGNDAKLYVKSAFGANSAQYKAVSGISFRKL